MPVLDEKSALERYKTDNGPKSFEQCMKCQCIISHGEPFVPVVRNKTEKRLHDTNFIGCQHSSWIIMQVPAGAICIKCIL